MIPEVLVKLAIPVAVGVVTFGVGLRLAPADFTRLVRYPRAILVGLSVQMLLLVPLAFVIAQWAGLQAGLAVGLMLVAASPGGPAANLFSHLAGGDVALNITLTAVNSVLALAWLPLVVGWSLEYFLGAGQHIPAPTQKIVELGVLIILPVVAGMAVRAGAPSLALRAQHPVRIASIAVIISLVAIVVTGAWHALVENFATVGLACIAFNVASLTLGYAVPRAFRLPPRQATAIALEIGVHNVVLALFIALQVLEDEVASVPVVIYSLIMFATAGLLSWWLHRQNPADEPCADNLVS
jgi:BASS family bile acid:Na+ symporter